MTDSYRNFPESKAVVSPETGEEQLTFFDLIGRKEN